MGDLRTVIDQMGRELTFSYLPKRIVSLVPSQTEFLIDIGAPVIGRSKFCIHPIDKVKKIPIIGGTKNFRFEVIKKLNPDLIIGNKEENYKEGIERLWKDFPVWMSDIYTLDDAFQMMQALGGISDQQQEASCIIEQCKQSTEKVRKSKTGKVVYLIWKEPWMAAGSNTFVDHMLHHLGYENLVKDNRYPELTMDEITLLNPEVILLSSEPFPFKEKHVKEAKALWPEADVHFVDGELYSWYGSRLQQWAFS